MMTTTTIKNMTSNQLIEQYEAAENVRWTCWDNANDGSGNCEAHMNDLDMMRDAEADSKALKAEILERRKRGTLYEGKRDMIRGIWAWAKTKTSDDKHAYNMMRKAVLKRGVVMLSYENSGIF